MDKLICPREEGRHVNGEHAWTFRGRSSTFYRFCPWDLSLPWHLLPNTVVLRTCGFTCSRLRQVTVSGLYPKRVWTSVYSMGKKSVFFSQVLQLILVMNWIWTCQVTARWYQVPEASCSPCPLGKRKCMVCSSGKLAPWCWGSLLCAPYLSKHHY